MTLVFGYYVRKHPPSLEGRLYDIWLTAFEPDVVPSIHFER